MEENKNNSVDKRAKWLFRLPTYRGIFILLIIILIYFFQMFRPGEDSIFEFLLILLFIYAPLIVLVEIYAALAYKNYKYKLKKNSIEIEYGVIWKQYTSISYNRIQNVVRRRGIIASLFGFTSMDIETAGGVSRRSSNYPDFVKHMAYNNYNSEGHIPAVTNLEADQINNFLISKSKGSGNF